MSSSASRILAPWLTRFPTRVSCASQTRAISAIWKIPTNLTRHCWTFYAAEKQLHGLKVERLGKVGEGFLLEELNRRGTARISCEEQNAAAVERLQRTQFPVEIDTAAARHFDIGNNEVVLIGFRQFQGFFETSCSDAA